MQEVCDAALKNNVLIRGYVSCVLGCPYEGDVAVDKVAAVAERLYKMGCYEVSFNLTLFPLFILLFRFNFFFLFFVSCFL